MIYALDDSFRVILLTLMCIEYGFVYIVTKERGILWIHYMIDL